MDDRIVRSRSKLSHVKRPFLAAVASAMAIGLMAAASGRPSQAPLREAYLGQTPPARTPQVFAPGFVSTSAHEFSCSFTPDGLPVMSPDGRYLFFTAGERGKCDIYWIEAGFLEDVRRHVN